MIRPINCFEWQVLRALARAGGPLLGRDLRLVPTRRTKDGAFLTQIALCGLIEPAGAPEPAPPQVPGHQRPAAPEPFRTCWRLTALGAHAAEYGEYEWDFDAARKAAPEAAAP